MPPVAFTKRSAPLTFDKSLGLCFGWFCFSKRDGQPYIDAHGDHIPDDELIPAVDGLMAMAASDRLIDVEHVGGGRGVIATAQALTEDVAKSMNIDTGGTYGVIGSFRPDGALLKSIQSGDMFCLSIFGAAGDVETIAKSAGETEIAATAHKRTLRKVSLTRLAVCKLGAHDGAAVALIKSASDAARQLVAAQVAKRQHALTDIIEGHQHVVYDVDDPDMKVGSTSYETTSSSGYGHSHSWIRNPDGSISIVVGSGHAHALATTATDLEKNDMPTDLEKSQAAELLTVRADLAKSNTRCSALSAALFAAVLMPPDQAAFAKSLSGDALEAYIAKPSTERATIAAPVHKSADGTLYFAGDDPRMVQLAKAHDAQGAELAKSRESGEQTEIAKSAAAVPCIADAALIVKAIRGHKLTADEQTKAMAQLATSNASIAMVTKSVGHGGPADLDAADPKAVLEKAAVTFIKSRADLSAIEARREFGRTDEGQQLYAAAYPTN